MGIFFANTTFTKLNFTNGVYYDEYLSLNHQPYFASSLYVLATIVSFLLAFALEVVFIGSTVTTATVATATNYVTIFTGLTFIVVGLALMGLKLSMWGFELNYFDKIHLAIEKNFKESSDYLFIDPINKTVIKQGILPSNPNDKE